MRVGFNKDRVILYAMEDQTVNKKRIRDSAPYRKTIALSEIDLRRAEYLERIYPSKYPYDAPFNFSKLISKALEVAYLQALLPESTGNKENVHAGCQHSHGNSHDPKRNRNR